MLCKRGCGRPACWKMGRLAKLCEVCAVDAKAAWLPDQLKGALSPKRRGPRCSWRDCDKHASRRVFFGRLENGVLAPGVVYCDPHAAEVHERFLVERDIAATASLIAGIERCRATARHGGGCQRPAVHDGYCPSHRRLSAHAA